MLNKKYKEAYKNYARSKSGGGTTPSDDTEDKDPTEYGTPDVINVDLDPFSLRGLQDASYDAIKSGKSFKEFMDEISVQPDGTRIKFNIPESMRSNTSTQQKSPAASSRVQSLIGYNDLIKK